MNRNAMLAFAQGHPVFAGHFPGFPIVPGVMLLDAALHALAAESGQEVGEISSAKFLRPVAPGEVLALHSKFGDADRGSFEILIGELRAAIGQVRMGLADSGTVAAPGAQF